MRLKHEKIETLFEPFDGDIREVIAKLEKIIKDNPQYVNIWISPDYDAEYHIIGFRPEDEIESEASREKDMKLMEKLAQKHNCTIMINEYQ